MEEHIIIGAVVVLAATFITWMVLKLMPRARVSARVTVFVATVVVIVLAGAAVNAPGSEEQWIRGAVRGALYLLLGLALVGIIRLFKSPSEGARRTRWVLGGGAALFVLAFIGDMGGIPAVAITLVVLGLGIWVYRGFKNP